MRPSHLAAVAAVALGMTVSATMAQHADFVLFGDPNPAAAAVPAEQKFVHPVTTPYFHEDSFVTSDIRVWYAYHDFPNGGVIDGGHAQVYAVQARLALTDRLQLVAYKDGYVDLDAGLTNDDGWNDVGAGIKYNFLQDWDRQLHAAVGIGYEFAVGSPSVLQNDDELRGWVSVNKGFDRLHLGGTFNILCPMGGEDALGDSTRIVWNLHADYYVCEWFSPVIEMTGVHSVDDGDEVVPFSGVDIASLGGGDSLVTLGLGAEFRVGEDVAIRGACDIPLTDGDDLYGWRFTASLVYSF